MVLSAADTELACLAAAAARRAEGSPSLRLANLLQLGHPLSVDLYVERVVAQASLVVLRLLGGRSYWPYGLEQMAAACRAQRIALAVLPGDDQPDPELAAWSTLPPEACHRLWQYGVHGGLDNARQMLAYGASLIGRDEPWQEPAPLLRAGLYWPGIARPALADLRRRWRRDRPVAALVFYRALVQAGDLAAIDALIEALAAAGLNPLPVFTASLKDPVAAPLVRHLLAEAAPEVVLNATGFAVSSPGQHRATPLDEPGRCVLQLVLAGGSEAAWRAGTRGLSPRDLAMNVALPEIDGRVLARAVAFKSRQRFDPRTETEIVGFAPVADRVRFAAELAAAWARLAEAARGRAPGRDRARQLSEPRRPPRQRRRSRHAGEHGPPAFCLAGRGLSDRRPAHGRAQPRRRAPRRRHQRIWKGAMRARSGCALRLEIT